MLIERKQHCCTKSRSKVKENTRNRFSIIRHVTNATEESEIISTQEISRNRSIENIEKEKSLEKSNEKDKENVFIPAQKDYKILKKIIKNPVKISLIFF